MQRRSKPSVDDVCLSRIRQQACDYARLSDSELIRVAEDLRHQGVTAAANELTTEIFALATDAVRRSTGKNYYDVQLQAGGVLAAGDLAEMATGEGKTLVTLLPVLNSVIRGHNVHVATTNSYLAQRDCEELRPAFESLGVSISLLPEENNDVLKRQAYNSDVTYGTGYEFGFDYLRDQLLLRQQPQDRLGDAWLRSLQNTSVAAPQLVQSARHATVIDEIDSVLIDEANTPLVISFFTEDAADDRPYRRAAAVADQLDSTTDYHINHIDYKITITASGADIISRTTRDDSPQNLQRPWRIYVEQALRARHLLKRDIDYVVRKNAVALVDQQTGRIFPERKWRDGLHQAIECLQGVPLTAETNSFARISRQRFFKLYGNATGMTGTATDAVAEFEGFFGLNVVPIPLNQTSLRVTLPPRFFSNNDAKYEAIIADVVARHRSQQPVLIGTRTIQQSLEIAAMLQRQGLPHHVLNGLQDADEAAIVALAGQPSAITVATNMAGRGTDIKLTKQSREVGGLHVVVTEPNRSHRVDRQLIGRCARQGDPGSCQIFASAEDELLYSVGTSMAKAIVKNADSGGQSHFRGLAALRSLQRRAEQVDYVRRKHLMSQECWVEGVLGKLVGEG